MEFSIQIGGRSVPSTKREKKGKSIISFPKKYCIVDIETTGFSPVWDSIIEIGAISYSDGEETGRFQTLVQPPVWDDGTYISQFIEELTGITNEMLSTAPPTIDALKAFDTFMGDSLVVGYNTSFDVNFLYDNYEQQLGKPFPNNFIDVMRIARKLHPELPHHRLKDMAAYFGTEPTQEHRAIADCETTALCFDRLHIEVLQQYSDEEQFARAFKKKSTAYARACDIRCDTSLNDVSSPFYQRNIVITGKLEKFTRSEAMKLIANIGGINEDSVTKKTNILILGNNDYCPTIRDGKSGKHKKAEALKLKGQDIEVIPETVFYDMIAEYASKERE